MYQQNNLRRLAHRITITVTSLLPAAVAALGLALGAGVLLPAEAQAGSCGGNGQRPCKLWERVPSCNSGLVEDFAKGKCIKVTKNTPKAGNRRVVCGGQGQRPCRVTERIPSCNSGLVEDFAKDRCVKITANTPVRGARPSQSTTKLSLCNNSVHSKVWAAYGYYDEQSGSWMTEGHWTLGRGECKTHDLGVYQGPVYMYGSAADGSKWTGDDAALCMNLRDAFEIRNADKQCNGYNNEWVDTYKFDIGPGSNRWNYN